MNQYLTIVLIAALPGLSLAQEPEPVSPYYIKGGINGSVLDDAMKDSEAMGLEAMLGVQFDNGIFIEAGYQNFDLLRDDNISLDAASARLNWKFPISDYASLYAGGGMAVIGSDVNPSTQLGLQYQLSNNWIADVSYQGIFGIDKVDDDLYALNLSLVYRFPGAKNTTTSVVDPIDEIPEVVAPPVYVQPVPPTCRMEDQTYTLVYGDYLIGVAQAHNTDLAGLVRLNPSLKGRNLDLVYPGEVVNVPSKEVCK